MKQFITMKSLFCVLLFSICITGEAKPKAKLTIKVVDEDHNSLSNMPVHVWMSESNVLDDYTDSNGVFIAKGVCTVKDVPISVVKQGYYPTRMRYSFPNWQSVRKNKWQPWNPTVVVVLRKKIKPIPMYAKKVWCVIPVLDEFVGFDFEKGDWIAPYGKGNVADFNLRIKKRYVDMNNFDSSLDVAITNCIDGLQKTSLKDFNGSGFRLLREAPINDYAITSLYISESSTNYFKPNKDESYYFRIRSETNKYGEVTSALYGKIRSYISFDVRRDKTGSIGFTYYLNPTPNDRNLEFNPKANLFKNLTSLEEVSAP